MLDPLLAGFLLILTVGTLTSAYANQLRIGEGATLFYKGARISSGISGQQTFDAAIKILTLNQTALIFQSSSTSTNSSIMSEMTVKYQDGIPTYADYITAMFYLPPECMAQSLLGNLEWTTQINTNTLATVTNETWQTLNFTTEAGTFQSINITLTLKGLEYGTLTLIYNESPGVLIYEQWTPTSADIVILSLIGITNAPGTQQTLLNLILPTLTLATPITAATHQTYKKFKKRNQKNEQIKETMIETSFPKKAFYIILAGASLNLASVFLPWSQFAGSQIYLPLSLPSALTGSSEPLASTSTFATISLIAHATAILVWVSIVIHLYTTKKATPQLATIASSILAFASVAIFIQTGWTSSWGLLIMVIGGILTITGTVAANIKIEITAEEPEESEDTSLL